MSDLYDGYVTLRRLPTQGMVTLRGDLGAARIKAALRSATGCDVPAPRQITRAGGLAVGWMSPDEVLVFAPHDAAAGIAAALGQALAGQHHLALDVSDARVMFELHGAAVREVLAKLTPADVAHLPEGELRRSRLGQVAAAFWLEAQDRARLIAFRSVADYVMLLLSHAARPGSELD